MKLSRVSVVFRCWVTRPVQKVLRRASAAYSDENRGKIAISGKGRARHVPGGKLSQRGAIYIRSEFERARARFAKNSPAILAEIGLNARKTGRFRSFWPADISDLRTEINNLR
ncbi:hypothetical protein DR92_4577 (plasmid) [Brucella anthropi]|nr:hypothetical protein DR92_4577 [Brucella anthropi]